MLKKVKDFLETVSYIILDFIKTEYKFLIITLLTFIIFTAPVNYYIIVGGGTSDINSRIEVEDAYKAKGSFNISYVTELKATVLSYLVSYLKKDWKRVKMDDYKYEESESVDDIEFRSDISLDNANATAIKWAYTLANKSYKETSSKIYVTSTFSEYKNNLLVQDEILSIDGKHFNDISDYQNYLNSLQKNQQVTIKIKRKNKVKEVQAKLYQSDDRLILGVLLEVVKSYETKPKITIKFKESESGPSGGLITTLDIYNKLTKKDLTHSLKIAGTGTIEADGSIGEIGEVKYKLLGAVADKADLFLVPKTNNYDECLKVKKEKNLKIDIIGVSNIQEAIDILNNYHQK